MLIPWLRLLARTKPLSFNRLCLAMALLCLTASSQAEDAMSLRYFPAGRIYEYRWKLLDLALQHTRDEGGPIKLVPADEDITQDRGVSLLQEGDIDVIALGTNREREAKLLPIRIDILKGIVGFRVLVIREKDQARIARMDAQALRKQLTFGLNSQWADLPIMRANGFSVETSSSYEALFSMLAEQRFDAFPRGLNEAYVELKQHKAQYPHITLERSKALYFPYPVYFWVNKRNTKLAMRIERGLKLTQEDGSFRRLFESYHAAEIAALKKEPRQVIRLTNPILTPSDVPSDTSWWWRQ
jgi:hypothetical protein